MSPPPSATASPLLKRRRSTGLSIDLSDLPALTQPSPPSNTLLITNLQDPQIFSSAVLDNIQKEVNKHATLHTFSPLRSMRRIICTFYTTEDAIKIKQVLDNESVMGHRVRIYFGQNTKIDNQDIHLRAPKSNKLFFISPPPSPPMGWEMRNEEPPNKDVHAEDLATALSRLQARPTADEALYQNEEPARPSLKVVTRPRSGTGTVVYDPEEHGHSPLLPMVAVEDTSASPEEMSPVTEPMEGVETKIARTSRPPVELMEQ